MQAGGGLCDTGPGASALKRAVGEDGTPPLQARPMLGTEGCPGDWMAVSGWYRDDLIAPDFFWEVRGVFVFISTFQIKGESP